MARATHQLTHADLCEVAVRWLKRPLAKHGHGCAVAFSEIRPIYYGGETPDAIGFRASGSGDGSVVVEVKVSRADFLADRKKPHREPGKGMGRWRYYLCPEGLITVDELPDKWGLVYVDARGRATTVHGAALGSNVHASARFDLFAMDRNMEQEQLLLVRLLARVADPETTRKKLNKLQRQLDASQRTIAQQREQLAAHRVRMITMRLGELGDHPD